MLQKNPIDLIKIQFQYVIKVFKRPNYMNCKKIMLFYDLGDFSFLH